MERSKNIRAGVDRELENLVAFPPNDLPKITARSIAPISENATKNRTNGMKNRCAEVGKAVKARTATQSGNIRMTAIRLRTLPLPKTPSSLVWFPIMLRTTYISKYTLRGDAANIKYVQELGKKRGFHVRWRIQDQNGRYQGSEVHLIMIIPGNPNQVKTTIRTRIAHSGTSDVWIGTISKGVRVPGWVAITIQISIVVGDVQKFKVQHRRRRKAANCADICSITEAYVAVGELGRGYESSEHFRSESRESGNFAGGWWLVVNR
ncbi:hypothetical protein DFH09DRAFT_1068926 [Mycena vulgaris]|nr:hypothetical protein DFH09DRAFT_1068926 [Mycena vulgaris]